MKRTAAWAPRTIMTAAAAVALTLRYETRCRAVDGTGMREHVGRVLDAAGIRFEVDFADEAGGAKQFRALAARAAVLFVVDRPTDAVTALLERVARLERVNALILIAPVGRLGFMPATVAGKVLHVVHLAAEER